MNAQVLALAGVFQATELVRQAAHHGAWSGYAASASLASLFRLEADSVEEIYGDREKLRLGLETLTDVLGGDGAGGETLQHAVALLQLQRKFSRHGAMMHEVAEGLETIERDTEPVEDPRQVHRRHRRRSLQEPRPRRDLEADAPGEQDDQEKGRRVDRAGESLHG